MNQLERMEEVSYRAFYSFGDARAMSFLGFDIAPCYDFDNSIGVLVWYFDDN